MMPTPDGVLEQLYDRASADITKPAVEESGTRERIEYICRCLSNRAGVRLLLACLLAKIDQPNVDLRQPYTEIAGERCFSGRTYDEQYITRFVNRHRLPCNSTTAFLTPALRNVDQPLTTGTVIVGRPRRLYQQTLQVLDDVAADRVSAEDALVDVIRQLIVLREEKRARMEALLAGLEQSSDALPLSAEQIVTLIQQHLACRNSSRLPVLVVAAAYQAASSLVGESAKALEAHNAADQQTGALGDVEVCLANEDDVLTSYEMKMKRVTNEDIDRAVTKIVNHSPRIDNYVFITTDVVEPSVAEYAASMYERLNGTEIVILDCIGFIRHFLHFFHRLRIEFLNGYQGLVLAEPDSAVRQPLKEAFLTLRHAAESDE